MSKKKEAATPDITVPDITVYDPTLATVSVTIKGKTYTLCFDLGALAHAEHELLMQGYDVNLLTALPKLNLTNVRIIFGAALRRFHPEIEFEDALALLTLSNIHDVSQAIIKAWNDSLAEPEEAKGEQDPPSPGL